MKYDMSHADIEMEQLLKERLEQEKAQGIPSIPEQLRPEHMEVLLEGRKKTNKKRFILPGGVAAAVAAAAVMLIFQPGRKEMMKSADMSGNTAATAAAPMTAASQEIIMEMAEEEGLFSDIGGQDTTADESKTEAVLKPEGSYEAACIEEDYLYLLQKTEVHELYVINLRNPESEWQKHILSVSEDVEIINLYIEDSSIYLESKEGKKYVFLLDK